MSEKRCCNPLSLSLIYARIPRNLGLLRGQEAKHRRGCRCPLSGPRTPNNEDVGKIEENSGEKKKKKQEEEKIAIRNRQA